MSYSARKAGMTAVRTSAAKTVPAIYPAKAARASFATFKVPTINNDVNVGCGTQTHSRKGREGGLVAN